MVRDFIRELLLDLEAGVCAKFIPLGESGVHVDEIAFWRNLEIPVRQNGLYPKPFIFRQKIMHGINGPDVDFIEGVTGINAVLGLHANRSAVGFGIHIISNLEILELQFCADLVCIGWGAVWDWVFYYGVTVQQQQAIVLVIGVVPFIFAGIGIYVRKIGFG